LNFLSQPAAFLPMSFSPLRKSVQTLFVLLLVFASTGQVLAAAFKFGELIADGGLQMASVYHPNPTASGPLLSLAPAFASGKAQIRETGNVNLLEIENLSDEPLVLLAGEIVEGGLQDRAIASDVVVPPKSSLKAGVFCVEKGRWSPLAGGDESRFKPSGVFLDGDARAAAQSGGAAQSNQLAVWEQVSKALSALGVEAPTGNYREVAKSEALVASKERAARFKRAIADDRTAVGLAVAYRGQVQKIEAFADPALFAAYRDQLIDSYVATASKQPPGRLVGQADLVDFADAFVGDARRETVFPGGKRLETEGREIALFELLDESGRNLHYLKVRLPPSPKLLTADAAVGSRSQAYALVAIDAKTGRVLPDCSLEAKPPSRIADVHQLKDGTGQILFAVVCPPQSEPPVVEVSGPMHEPKLIVLDSPSSQPLKVSLTPAVFRLIW
jgi:hypothetical protein